jgi:hypothetical protein
MVLFFVLFRQAEFTSYAHLFCPTTPYEYNQNITRSVYCDGETRVKFWKSLFDEHGILGKLSVFFSVLCFRHGEGVEDEAKRGLSAMFPGVAVPKPVSVFEALNF